MPKEHAFEQILRTGATVDRDERFVLAITVVVERPCNEFLTRTALPVYECRAVSIRHLLDLGEDGLHFLAVADDVIELVLGFQLLAQADVFMMQTLKFEGT